MSTSSPYETPHSPEDEAAIDLALSLREAIQEETDLFEALRQAEESATRSPMRALDPEAFALIVKFETGGKGYYQSKLSRPTWPGYYSGVTIGFGYDLQSDRVAKLTEVWGGILSPDQLRRLSAGCGLKGGRDTERIKAILDTVQDIVIPWDVAERVYREQTVPRYRKILLDSLPQMAAAPAKCEGALLSLVFNRGTSFAKGGDRYAEMREVKRMVDSGRLEGVPAQLRSMKRLWLNSPPPHGLQGRREAEAALFEKGLREGTALPVTPSLATAPPPPSLPQPLAAPPVPASPEAVVEAGTPLPQPVTNPLAAEAARVSEPLAAPQSAPLPASPAAAPALASPAFPPVPAPAKWPEDVAPVKFRSLPDAETLTRGTLEGGEESTEPSEGDLALDRFMDGTRGVVDFAPTRGSAYWASKDENSTEYAHLTSLEGSSSFDLTPEVIEALIAANRFDPDQEQSIFALGIRGSVLTADGHEAERRDRIALTDTRPDHIHFKCTVGFYHRAEGKITLYAGSTVPCPYYMRNYYLRMNKKAHQSDVGCNLMPCGCYLSRVGTHGKGSIDPAVRTTDPANPTGDAWVTVLRTTNDVVFGLQDTWDRTQPYDNIHCSYFLNESPKYESYFSSAGCTTVRGRKGNSTDPFGKFQKTLLQIGKGRRIDYLLLTGKEYAVAAEALRQGQPALVDQQLTRLRTGSMSEEVRRLQKKLGFSGSGYFGASTKKALAEYQRSHGVTSDGIYSPELDARFHWGVFNPNAPESPTIS